MTSTPVLVPLLNANEPEARLVEIHVEDRQAVEAGAILFTVETTKAASDVEAPEKGYVRLTAQVGDTLAVGDMLALITSSADEPLDQPPHRPDSLARTNSNAAPESLRITKPARTLAETLGLDLSRLPTDRLVTEALVRQLAGDSAAVAAPSSADVQPASAQILVYGAGGHAKTVMEMVRAIGAFRIAGILDDDSALQGKTVLGIPVLGGRELLPELVKGGVRLAANGVGGIIDINVRVKLFTLMAGYGLAFPILKHPRATLEPSARIEDGVQVFANAYVGAEALLHECCMVNTGAVVSHDCEIGAYTHIAPGALLAGHVHVGARVLVGMGVTTMIGVTIGDGARIGNGAVLLADVPARQIVPAGKVWTGTGNLST